MAPTPGPYRHGPEDDRPFRVVGDLMTIKARQPDTGGAFSVIEMTVAPGSEGPHEHHHPDFEESFYVIEGDLRFTVDGRSVPAPRGTFLVVPRGATHGYANPGDSPVRVLVLISPPGFEQHFIDMGEPVDTA